MNANIPLSTVSAGIDLRLPGTTLLESIGCRDLGVLQTQCTYKLTTVSHALQHALGILSIATLPLNVQDIEGDIVSCSVEYMPWLLDSYLRLFRTQQRWRETGGNLCPPLTQNTLRLITASRGLGVLDEVIQQKAYCLLVLLCVDIFESNSLAEASNNDSELLLCSALIAIAEGCIKHRHISKLAASQLMPIFDKAFPQGEGLVFGNDLSVRTPHAQLCQSGN
jgi:hypothetical protein